MAKNQVTLTFAGDSKSLETAFDRAGTAAKDLAGDFDKTSGEARRMAQRVDVVGTAVGNQESKFMGTADVLDGLNTAFGLGLDQQIAYARAAGDVAGGIETLKDSISTGVDAVGKMADKFGAASKAAIMTRVQTVRAAAAQSVAWAKSAAQAMASAIRVRAAWLISMGPIALVVAAVAGAVFLIVRYWDEIKGAAKATWEWVRDRFSDLAGFFSSWAPLLLGPIGLVIKEWDKLVGGATAVWEGIKAGWDAISGVPEAILKFIRDGVTDALEGLGTAGKVVGQAVWGGVKDAWAGLRGVADAIAGFVRGGVTDAIEGLATAGKVVGQAVWGGVKGAWDEITGVGERIVSFVRGGVTDAIEGATTTAKRIGTAIWSGIKAGLDGIKDRLWGIVKGAIDYVLGLIPGPVKRILGLPGGTGRPMTADEAAAAARVNAPRKHVGGIVPGPRGTEQSIMALAGERIVAPGASAGPPVQVNVYALDPRAAANAVAAALREYTVRNGPIAGIAP